MIKEKAALTKCYMLLEYSISENKIDRILNFSHEFIISCFNKNALKHH